MSAINETPVAVAVNITEDDEIRAIEKQMEEFEERKKQLILKKQIGNKEFQTQLIMNVKDDLLQKKKCNEVQIKINEKCISDLEKQIERYRVSIEKIEDNNTEITEELENIEGIDYDEDDVEDFITERYKKEAIEYIEKKQKQAEKVTEVIKKAVKKVGKKDDLFANIAVDDNNDVSSVSSGETYKKTRVKYDREQQFTNIPVGLKMTLSYKGRTANYEKTEMGLLLEGDTTEYDTLNKAAKKFFGADKKSFNAWDEFKTICDGKKISLAKYVEM